MAKLEDFLGKSKPDKKEPNANGSFQCQECDEVVIEAYFNEEERILEWFCSSNHKSNVRL